MSDGKSCLWSNRVNDEEKKKRRTLNYMSGVIYLYKAVKLVSRKKNVNGKTVNSKWITVENKRQYISNNK